MRIMAECVEIPSPAGGLTGVLWCPEDRLLLGTAVISCPHPMLGGTADNPVVIAMVEGVLAAGGAALVWNHAAQETLEPGAVHLDFLHDPHAAGLVRKDMELLGAVGSWLQQLGLEESGAPPALAGYSYGGLLSAMLASAPAPALAIAPPLEAVPAGALIHPAHTTLLLAGEDFAVTPADAAALARRHQADWAGVTELPGADHFLLDHLPQVRRFTRHWFRDYGAQPSARHASNLL